MGRVLVTESCNIEHLSQFYMYYIGRQKIDFATAKSLRAI
jgi:hypothetical protein